ncbi:MAG: 2-succinyl-5-enolpyruvyl-6-hydroxy-3-cyclohexene-1-carboxylic-acid synthase [Actinobacteria bacterium]|nr:2-succinyl-5-enolpyruvyl-6-hydroxy-3-cyclohexene-1-carboxylic-acid synthase [Actinomycetota bacterium]
MIPINRTYAPVQAFVEELGRCGMRHAVTSPGSRNAPLALALAAEPRIEAHSVVDERSAGFVALGLAKLTGRPVALACTSGTAAANLMPAVVEAREARVPLVVMTADRPPELRDVGAGQAIDQIRLYGPFAKWFVEVGSHEPERSTAIHFRALACRAYDTASASRPGPVHLNFPLREPLAPIPEELDTGTWAGRDDGAPWAAIGHSQAGPDDSTVRELADAVSAARRGLLVVGTTRAPEETARAVARLAAVAGWPALAEPTSGLRCGPQAATGPVVAHYDALLACERFTGSEAPELVVRIGDTPTSKRLRALLEGSRQIVVDPDLAWHEPTRTAERLERCDPALLCGRLAERVAERRPRPDHVWLRSWLDADGLVPGLVAGAPEGFEPRIWNAVAAEAPHGSTLWVASSMPIRDIETYLPRADKPLHVLANRGANGIDGTISSAAGAALGSERRVFALVGDLALVHDLGGLLSARQLGVELTVVCVNNGGGGIFDFLPVAAAADREEYERYIATPVEVDLEAAAAMAGMPYRRVEKEAEVRAAVGSPGLVEVRTDRGTNVEMHRSLIDRLRAAISPG